MRKAHVWSMVAVFFAIGLVFTGSASKMTEFSGGWASACKAWLAQSYVIELEPRGK